MLMQLIEHLPSKQVVARSIRARRATCFSTSASSSDRTPIFQKSSRRATRLALPDDSEMAGQKIILVAADEHNGLIWLQ